MLKRTISIAPMMDYTDRHFRYLARLISHQTLLYTEMITAYPILDKNKRDMVLGFNAEEHPLALQLGGSDAKELAECARIAEAYGYDEINLNAGCPSDRVRRGRFGACLMKEPALVAACMDAMISAVKIPVTIKIRIGVDDFDSFAYLKNFVKQIADAGCKSFIVHARKALLKGLSPKDNRTIPPLHYETVYQLKREFPDLTIVINGGVKTLEQAELHLRHVDGVMIGREAYHNPFLLVDVDSLFYGAAPSRDSRRDVLIKFLPYLQQQLQQGNSLKYIVRHLFGLFQGIEGARLWRRYLSDHACNTNAGIEVIQQAYQQICF